MIPILSVVTSVKDYLEVVHKLIEYDSESISKYTELGPLVTYVVLSLKNFLMDFVSLSWLKNIWSLPILIPDISSAMISEISVLDGYFHNAFNFLDTPALSPNEKTVGLITGMEKFTIGLLNSCFLFFPTSTAHIITLRRFVMQGLEAGYISGLGTIAGNVFWLASVILGWRFFVIPWLSLDILRYVLGFALLVKYMWDSYNERKMVLEDLSKRKIFLLNFLLALTEQTSIYPFISNISISPEASILETFPAENYMQFIFIHVSYLLGIGLGSFCLLQFTCWFWENPAFKLYMWVISSFKVSTGFYYKALNFMFLYLTMISAISSIPYYGLDYTITNPLGFVNDDRLIQDKSVLETSFLGTKASDRNTRRNRGRHGRRERWKRRIRKYRTFDASLYDQGIYDLFTIEDLNYGFDRFWLRRKLRNHRVRFRFFPGPWMRSFKKQLAKPRLESYTGPRIEFFRILFEQVYHPSFHERSQVTNTTSPNKTLEMTNLKNLLELRQTRNVNLMGITNKQTNEDLKNTTSNSTTNSVTTSGPVKGTYGIKDNLIHENSMLRKFVRKLDSRLKTAEIVNSLDSNKSTSDSTLALTTGKNANDLKNNNIYSKRWKEIFSKIYHAGFSSKNRDLEGNSKNFLRYEPKTQIPTSNIFFKNVHRNFYNSSLVLPNKINIGVLDPLDQKQIKNTLKFNKQSIKKQSSRLNTLSNKDLQILRYRSLLTLPKNQDNVNSVTSERSREQTNTSNINSLNSQINSQKPFLLLHPLKFYLQQEAAMQRKLRYYTPNIFRKFSVENNAPYFRVMMRRYFYNYKPTNRWERTMKVGSLRKARRKTTRTPRKLRLPQYFSTENNLASTSSNLVQNSNPENKVTPIGLSGNISTGNPETPNLVQRIQKPTYNYSVVSKKASRYRYQIYKDVMQHWYYSPFNRLLLKFDVDSFIRRQPKTHFLTSKEENLLHLRRFFLSEHYNTLRWYTNMEHYRTMKTKIGGSKSFSSRAYDQQFAGTFKKIRHLFAITPAINSSFPFIEEKSKDFSSRKLEDFSYPERISKTSIFDENLSYQNKENNSSNAKSSSFNTKEPQQETNVLKFDQPLYNEYPNNSKTPLLNPLVIHEELLSPSSPNFNNSDTNKFSFNESISNKTLPNEDFVTQSQKVVREYLNNSSQVRQDYIKQLLNNKNYASLTDFLYSGQKLRGNKPTTNEKTLSSQEKEYLLTPSEKEDIENQYNSPEVKRMLRENLNDLVSEPYIEKGVKAKPLPVRASLENLYTTFLKNWKRRVNHQEALKNYLTRRIDKREKRKMYKEKMLHKKFNTLNDWLSKSKSSQTSDSKFTQDFSKLTPMATTDQNSEYLTSGLQKAISDGISTANTPLEKSVGVNMAAFNKLDQRSTVKKLETLRLSQKQKLNREIQTATDKLHLITKQLDKKPISRRTVTSLKNRVSSLIKSFRKTYGGLSLINYNQITKFAKPIQQKSLNNWRKKQRAIGKQKRLRKEFKLLLTKKQSAQQTVLDIPNRKKRISSTTQNNPNGPSTTNSIGLHNILANDTSENNSFLNNNYLTSFFNFKRERSPQRRYRVRKSRGVFRKRNLGDLMKKDIKIFFNKTSLSGASLDPQDIIERNGFYSKMHYLKGGAETNSKEFIPTNKLDSRSGETAGSRADIQRPEDFLSSQGQNYLNVLEFKQARVKQRKNKQRKLRAWKQKRMALRASQKRRKYLKRRRYSISKIRVLSKQFKRVKNKLEIQNWWWKHYLPSLQASTDALWQIEKDRLIQTKLAQLSPQEIMQRDGGKNSKGIFALGINSLEFIPSTRLNANLQIGNKDFKPLALPEAMRIQSNLNSGSPAAKQSNYLETYPTLTSDIKENSQGQSTNLDGINSQEFIPNDKTPKEFSSSSLDNKDGSQIVNQLYENLFLNQKSNLSASGSSSNDGINTVNTFPDKSTDLSSPLSSNNVFGLLPNTSLPFYAGWDESLRKFVVTNRLLSRQDAGYEVDKSFVSPNMNSTVSSQDNSLLPTKAKFTEAPLQGMNAATTLYWQIPFTTYDPDQFFALGMDGFSPIAWRKMLFRHSILKTWLGDQTMRHKTTDSVSSPVDSYNVGIKNTVNHKDLLSTLQKTNKGVLTFDAFSASTYPLDNRDNSNQQDGFNVSRRLKKRLLRVKKHPRTPVWFPSGPLLNQVLPVHYIYVFYKRSRLPRNRYLSRRLLSVNNINNSETLNNLISSNPAFYNYDFTLRKRLKPKRKYHLKHDTSIVIPRRLKFLNWVQPNTLTDGNLQVSSQQDINSLVRWRPISSKKVNKSFSELMNEQKTLRAKRQQRLAGVSPMDQPSLRVKQLKRRVQRQVIRAVWRYRPRAGGFVWPGDYLKLESVSIPQLTPNVPTQDKKSTKTRKKKRKLVEWQIQPKKYLYQKHNIRVLKKKLERAGRSNNTKQKVKEFNLKI